MRIELSGNTPGDVAWQKACWAPSAGILKSTLLRGGCVRGWCVSVPGGGVGVGKRPNRTKSEPCFTRGSGFPRGQASAAGEGGPCTHCMTSDGNSWDLSPQPSSINLIKVDGFSFTCGLPGAPSVGQHGSAVGLPEISQLQAAVCPSGDLIHEAGGEWCPRLHVEGAGQLQLGTRAGAGQHGIDSPQPFSDLGVCKEDQSKW